MLEKGWKKTILIMDDEAGMRKLFTRILSRNGYKVLSSSDGEGGLDLIKDNVIDLVLLDLRLPGIQGMDVLREIRKKGWDMPVIIITGFGDEESEKEAKRLGASAYIHKPFRLENIKDLIEKNLY